MPLMRWRLSISAKVSTSAKTKSTKKGERPFPVVAGAQNRRKVILIIIGERINSTKKSIAKAVVERNAELLQTEAEKQVKAGAAMLDVNCGTLPAEDEPAALKWLVETIQAVTTLPLCVDSPNPAALAMGLAAHRNGKPLINSISGETERFRQVLPLVKQYNASVVALCMDDSGIPTNYDRSVEVMDKMINELINNGVAVQDIFFDPLLRSVATSGSTVVETLKLMDTVSQRFPGIHITCGLSNVSHGLPERRHLNRSFLVLAMEHGMDAPIIDPCDPTVRALAFATDALLCKDKFCLNYTRAFRQGLLQE
jgi:cobalamin-dependent methionine synthase I